MLSRTIMQRPDVAWFPGDQTNLYVQNGHDTIGLQAGRNHVFANAASIPIHELDVSTNLIDARAAAHDKKHGNGISSAFVCILRNATRRYWNFMLRHKHDLLRQAFSSEDGKTADA